MNIIGVIPVRMGSSRFSGKPLKKINGKPMTQIIFENCSKSKLLKQLYIATCDKEIFEFAQSKNFKVIMTSKKHKDSLTEFVKLLKKLKEDQVRN